MQDAIIKIDKWYIGFIWTKSDFHTHGKEFACLLADFLQQLLVVRNQIQRSHIALIH